MDTRKTAIIKTAIVRKSGIAKIFRDICHAVQEEAAVNMVMPDDSHDKMIAINTMHSVFDRLDEALEKIILEDDVIPIQLEGENNG